VIFDAMYSLADAVSVKEDWAFEQHRRARIVPAGEGAAFLPVPSRAGVRTTTASTDLQETVRLEEITGRTIR